MVLRSSPASRCKGFAGAFDFFVADGGGLGGMVWGCELVHSLDFWP